MTPRQVIDGHAVPMLDRSMSASRGWEVVVIGMDGRGDGDGDDVSEGVSSRAGSVWMDIHMGSSSAAL